MIIYLVTSCASDEDCYDDIEKGFIKWEDAAKFCDEQGDMYPYYDFHIQEIEVVE